MSPFDLAVWRRKPALIAAARYNLLAAAWAAPVALVTGLIAWQWKHEGVKKFPGIESKKIGLDR